MFSSIRKSLCYLIFLLGMVIVACSFDESANEPNETQSYIPLDDHEYPYAGIPRIVIHTENFTQILDTETKIPAYLQIWGGDAPESNVLGLTVKGHGNSSFHSMPQYSIKLEFNEKQTMFGMPKNKDWLLVSNFADKTLLKNFMIYKLALDLGDEYAPRTKFVEVYLNTKYMGLYLLVESIKVGKNRINIPQNDSSYLFEKTTPYRLHDPFVLTKYNHTFRVRYPKNPVDSNFTMLKKHLDEWESLLYSSNFSARIADSLLDVDDFIRYFWIQEFSKNHDGNFGRSVLLTWQKDDVIKMGPVWDFDESFGCTKDKLPKSAPSGWQVKNYGWYYPFFANAELWNRSVDYWEKHRLHFAGLADSMNVYAKEIKIATKNHFKRWNVLEDTGFWAYKDAFSSYEDAVDDVRKWILERVEWIDATILGENF